MGEKVVVEIAQRWVYRSLLKGVAAAMMARRTVEIRMLVRALLIGAVSGAGMALSAPAQAAVAGDTLLEPTPLILKDGRIANVSVYVLGFAPGQSVLGTANAQRLDGLSAQLATDCFLTAQVIGHVGSAEVGNDTLGAHRLARARADAVQASLIADGLPAKAIASVWDWQFMVREPRATLWVFRLTPGEDCEDKPLETTAPALVAGAEPPPAATSVSEARPAAAGSEARPFAQARDPEPAAPAASPEPDAVVRTAEAARPSVAAPSAPKQIPAEAPSMTQAVPAVSPKPAVAVASRADAEPAARQPDAIQPDVSQSDVSESDVSEPVAAKEPAAPAAPEVVAALPAPSSEQPATPAAAGAEALTITFPSNSSYFPPGTDTQLQALLRQLAEDRHYQVILQAAVSGSQKVVGAESPDEAVKYNQWLAERRVDRVRSWLDQNASGNALVVKPEYRDNDESRQVVVRLIPAA
jgi:outer membrane protein OmpA-like peptidoglycan-associated protein